MISACGTQPVRMTLPGLTRLSPRLSRLRLLEVIRAQPAGLGAAEAGKEVGLHQATARQHLELLVEAGLLAREAEPRTVRGRPRVIYRRSLQTEAAVGDGYHLLAGILASMIESSLRHPASAAELAGRAWGRSLVERPRPLEQLRPRAAESRVVALLDRLGFEPEPAGRRAGSSAHPAPPLPLPGPRHGAPVGGLLGAPRTYQGGAGGAGAPRRSRDPRTAGVAHPVHHAPRQLTRRRARGCVKDRPATEVAPPMSFNEQDRMQCTTPRSRLAPAHAAADSSMLRGGRLDERDRRGDQ